MDLRPVVAALEERFGICLSDAVFEGLREDLIEAGRGFGLTEPMEFAARIREVVDGDPLQKAISRAVRVPETYFYRHGDQLEALRSLLQASLQKRDAAFGTDVRVWSAACSSGEEAWTLALLLREWESKRRIAVLGTDLDAGALAWARKGVYGVNSVRGEDGARFANRLLRKGDRFEVPADVRPLVAFEFLNLADTGFPSAFNGTTDLDVICCRNVLIYFRRDTARRIVARMANALRPGGLLLVSPAETSALADHPILELLGPGFATRRLAPLGAEVPSRVHAERRARERVPNAPPPPARVAPRPAIASAPAPVRPSTPSRVTAKDPMVAYQEGLVELARGALPKAITLFRMAVFLQPDFAAAEMSMGVAFQRLGDEQEALRHLRRAVTLLRVLPPNAAVQGAAETVGWMLRLAQAAAETLGRSSRGDEQ